MSINLSHKTLLISYYALNIVIFLISLEFNFYSNSLNLVIDVIKYFLFTPIMYSNYFIFLISFFTVYSIIDLIMVVIIYYSNLTLEVKPDF
jgi:hypothetical protein